MSAAGGHATLGLLDRIDALANAASRAVGDSPLAAEIEDVRRRLHRPLRVAIAGRTKAGKSTLLNALVGERLAATDATECTRVVTWYRHDLGYSVTAVLHTGERVALDFDRSAGLEIRLGGLALAEVDRLEVGWPSSRLLDLTLIDTPGIDGGTSDATARTTAALVGDRDGPGDADAVVYLMRHLHQRDAEFLEAFEARSISSASPVAAVAVLSRADEIGAGRPDAISSAGRVAARYAADPRVSTLAMAVLPLAGLLAETAASLRESEVAALRAIAALDEAIQGELLLSVDRFRSLDANPLSAETREQLLARFGLFGLRLCLGALRDQPSIATAELAGRLVEASGIRDVEAVIRRHFAERSEVLRARTALASLQSIASRASSMGPDAARDLAAAIERVEASSPELGHLRLLHLVHGRLAALRDDERAEVLRVLGPGSLAERLGQPVGSNVGALRAVALLAIERWRGRSMHPLLDRSTVEAAEALARTYEGIFQQLDQVSQGISQAS